jgi:hypothetical protein
MKKVILGTHDQFAIYDFAVTTTLCGNGLDLGLRPDLLAGLDFCLHTLIVAASTSVVEPAGHLRKTRKS